VLDLEPRCIVFLRVPFRVGNTRPRNTLLKFHHSQGCRIALPHFGEKLVDPSSEIALLEAGIKGELARGALRDRAPRDARLGRTFH